ncbi:ribonuclease H-like domain-containing protein [Mycena sp. CBHHK59/15]|nr:ribonuclease H-like domain-containing protein [Mycena sp. CBHHK59/15]
MGWIRLPAGKYTTVNDTDKVSHCQLEVLVRFTAWGGENATSPLRILSFDIECLGRGDIFPQPDVDAVVQIGNIVSVLGEKSPPLDVLTLGACSTIAGATVLSHGSEAQMLQRWSDFVRTVDPDLVIGYNIAGFDLPYLLARASRGGRAVSLPWQIGRRRNRTSPDSAV